ncbi:MAG: hypothetical protein NVS3B1_07790 [Marmoricola sp.]
MEAATIPAVAELAGPPPGTIPEASGSAVEAAEEMSRPREAAALTASARQMFKFSHYLHVGPGAQECPDNGVGCENGEHFHAWLRLPNKFQQKDLHEKAMAAKARTLRRLKDPESDAGTVMEAELSVLRASGDEEVMVEDLLKGEFAHFYLKATEMVDEREEFEHINQDRERYIALIDAGEDAKPEEEQSDEFRELVRQVERYVTATKEALREVQQPKRDMFLSLGREGLADRLRDARIEELAGNAFFHTYNEWMWFIGTLDVEPHQATGRPHKRKWAGVGSMDEQAPGTIWGESPEVIEAIESSFGELETALQGAARGNS